MDLHYFTPTTIRRLPDMFDVLVTPEKVKKNYFSTRILYYEWKRKAGGKKTSHKKIYIFMNWCLLCGIKNSYIHLCIEIHWILAKIKKERSNEKKGDEKINKTIELAFVNEILGDRERGNEIFHLKPFSRISFSYLYLNSIQYISKGLDEEIIFKFIL